MRHISYRKFDGATLSTETAPDFVRGLGWVIHTTSVLRPSDGRIGQVLAWSVYAVA